MALSNNVNRTVKQLPKDIYHNLKKPMFYVLTGSLFLIASVQAAKAEVCAPDLHYMEKKEYESGYHVDYNYPISSVVDGSTTPDKAISMLQEGIRIIERDSVFMHQHNADPTGDAWDYVAVVDKEMIRQINCFQNGGKFAKSGADFDANGNYKGSSQQASNKKSKSGKGKNQEQVASANSNENNTNSTDSNNAESSDAKSKGKEFAKDEKRLHADACVAVRRDKNNVPAFKNICPYPIEVVWCSDSKEDPNQCDRGWYGQWNFGVGHSEPINAISVTHWKVAACKGEDSLYMNEELKRNRKVRCVNWKN